MEEMDDFGDLYTDLDDHVNAGAVAISEPKSEDPIGEADGKGTPVLEAEDANGFAESSDSSDSEDDLRIVLNDEDSRKFQPPQRVVIGNGAATAGWNDEEDEGDSLVLVTGKDRLGKDQKWADQLPQLADGLPQGGAERGSAKGGCRNWLVGSHFPGNARTSMPGRGDWDHTKMLCSGSTVPSNLGIPVAATFSLPRNRTIFDIGIEEFVQKPWKDHGVDVTDYFNFGLDEESWKSYCKSMDLVRQQDTMFRFPIYESSRLKQVFESEMVSAQALSSVVSPGGRGERFSSIHDVDKRGRGFEMPRGRAIQVEGGFGERIPSTDIRRPRLRDSDVVIRITMEDSAKDTSVPCEELKDVERGHTDGSVLKSEYTLHKSLSPDNDGQRFGETTSPVEHHCPENRTIFRGTTMEGKAKVDFKKGDAVDPSRAAASMLADESASCDQVLHSSSSSAFESHSKAPKDGFSLQKILSPSKKTSFSSVSGLQESIKSDCHLSNDSRSDATKTEQENSEDSTRDCSLSMGDQKSCGRTRLQSKVELHTPTDSEKASIQVYRKRQNVSYTMEASYRTRTGKPDYNIDAGGNLSCYEETEMLESYKSRSIAEKHVGEKPHVKNFHKNGSHDTSLRRNQDERDCLLKQRVATRDNGIKQRDFHESYHDDRRMSKKGSHDTSLWRNQDERDCLLKQRVATRDNGIKQRDFHENYHDDHRMRVVAHEDSNQSISEYKSLLTDKDYYASQKKERKNERWIRMEAEYNDMMFEEIYQEEYLQEMHGRHIPYCDREEEIFDHKFGRHVSHSTRELRSPQRRYKYESDSCFDINRSSGYMGNDAKSWRYLDHRLLDSRAFRERPIADERDWPDANSLTNHLPIPWKSRERLVDLRRLPVAREIQSKNKKDGCYFIPSSKDHHHSSYENALDFDNDDHIAEERDLYVDNIVSSDNSRYNWLAKRRLCPDEIKFRHQQRDGPSSPEGSSLYDRSSRHQKSHVSQHSGSGRKVSDDHLLNSARKKTITEGYSGSDSREHTSFVLDFFDKGRHELAAIEHREAANMHVNGWKGKFRKRGSEVIRGSESHSDMNHTINKKLKLAGQIEEVHTRKEVSPRTSKAEGSCSHPTSLQVERVQDHKSEQSNDRAIKNYYNKNPIPQDDDEIEEGQLIEEPDDQDVVSMTKDWNSEKESPYPAVEASWSNCLVEKNRQSKNSACKNKIVGGYDSNHILETLAKMEKRRERFKEPIAPKPVTAKIQCPQLEVAVVAEEVQPQRPARKRRWAGS